MQPLKPTLELPDPLPGFEHVGRRWNGEYDCIAARLMPGEFYVTTGEEVLITLLGSCVSACIRDPGRGIGGMNHFMLPETIDRHSHDDGNSIVGKATRYGNYAMEHLINSIMSQGGRRSELEVKIFGGSNLMARMKEIGSTNADFALDYIHTEGMNLLSQDLGGTHPRMVVYFPATGRARVKKMPLDSGASIVRSEQQYRTHIQDEDVGGSVELF